MTASANKSRIQRTDNFGTMPTHLHVLNLSSAPLLSPTLKGPLIRALSIQAEVVEMILVTGVLNGTTDDTTDLTDEPMSARGLLTTDVSRLINALGTTIVSMIPRVLVALLQLSTDKVTIVLPGTTVDGQRLLVLRTTNNHPLRTVWMTDGCHRHPPLLL